MGAVAHPALSAGRDAIIGKEPASIDKIRDRALGGAAIGGVVGTASAIGDHMQGDPEEDEKPKK